MSIEGAAWDFIDRDEVAELHRGILAYTNGDGALEMAEKPGCVDGAIGAAKSAAFYTDDDAPDLLVAAAYLLRSLARNHCYTDGNKRVAWMSVVRLFEVNDLSLRADQLEAAQLVNDVAEGKLDPDGVRRWLAVPGRILQPRD